MDPTEFAGFGPVPIDGWAFEVFNSFAREWLLRSAQRPPLAQCFGLRAPHESIKNSSAKKGKACSSGGNANDANVTNVDANDAAEKSRSNFQTETSKTDQGCSVFSRGESARYYHYAPGPSQGTGARNRHEEGCRISRDAEVAAFPRTENRQPAGKNGHATTMLRFSRPRFGSSRSLLGATRRSHAPLTAGGPRGGSYYKGEVGRIARGGRGEG